MRVWSRCGYAQLPKRGMLREPARRLAEDFDRVMAHGFRQIAALLAPLFGEPMGWATVRVRGRAYAEARKEGAV